MWPFEVALGRYGRIRVHSAAECWTCPGVIPSQIMGAGGSMLVHRAPLSRYKPLDPLSNMTV